MKIVVVGDAGTSPDFFAETARQLPYEDMEIVKLEWDVPMADIQKKLLNIELNGPESEEPPVRLIREIEDAEILLVHVCPVSRRIIEAGKKLKMIGACRGGLENIDVKAATDRGIPVFHVIRNAEPVADFTLGLMLSETRNIARSHHYIKEGIWKKEFSNSQFTTTLSEHKVGLVGLGHIGKLVAQRLLALNVKVLACDPFLTAENLTAIDSRIKMKSMEEIFRESDIVSLHLRLSEQTENIINKDLIEMMKPSAYLINTSRAGILEEKALINALEQKRIAGAALDVFWEEPLPENHPLMKLDNITLTSHIAGDTVDAIPKSPKLLIKVINDYLKTGRSDLIVNK